MQEIGNILETSEAEESSGFQFNCFLPLGEELEGGVQEAQGRVDVCRLLAREQLPGAPKVLLS